MTKNKIPMKHHPSGSLVRRVVLISLSLLVIPLILHTFFIYWQEYQEHVAEAKSLLEMAGQGEKEFLEEKIQQSWDLLDDSLSSGLEIPAPKGEPEYFVLPSAQVSALFVGKKITSSRALVRQIPYQKIFDQFAHFEKSPYPMALALLDREGKLLAGEVLEDSISFAIPMEKAPMILSLTLSKEAISQQYERGELFRFVSLLAFIVFIGGSCVFFLTRRVARPLKALSSTMQRVAEGAFHVRYVKDKMGFEINALGEQFNETLDALFSQQKIAEKEKIHRERLAEELRIGHRIQQSLLPTELPHLSEIEMATGYLPAREVSGDFYDVFHLKNGSIFFVIADAADKGISACLYSLGLRSLLRGLGSLFSDLSEVLSRANHLFCEDVKDSGMFVTLWAAIYDPQTRMLTYSNQGHFPPLLIRSGDIQELDTEGMAFGVEGLHPVKTQSILLSPEDLLFLYTDGVVEAENSDRKGFGKGRLFSELLKNQAKKPRAIMHHLLEKIEAFSGKQTQHDDITAIIFRILD